MNGFVLSMALFLLLNIVAGLVLKQAKILGGSLAH